MHNKDKMKMLIQGMTLKYQKELRLIEIPKGIEAHKYFINLLQSGPQI